MTLQNAVAKLGFFPDETGDPIRAILDGDDDIALLALGCYLDKAIDEGDFKWVIQGLADIKRGQERKAAGGYAPGWSRNPAHGGDET